MAFGTSQALGNLCTLVASHFLGMSIAFPLVESNVIIVCLLGALVFDEYRGTRARLLLLSAALALTAGAFTLSFFGVSAAPEIKVPLLST